jgi:hypothetical protein
VKAAVGTPATAGSQGILPIHATAEATGIIFAIQHLQKHQQRQGCKQQ